MKHSLFLLLVLITTLQSCSEPKEFDAEIRINQVGYDLDYPKKAVLQYDSTDFDITQFSLMDKDSNEVYEGDLSQEITVNNWGDKFFYTIDFSDYNKPGEYYLQVGKTTSYPFNIQKNQVQNSTAPMALNFFKLIRNTMSQDSAINVINEPSKILNVYGGWTDATGDQGKHLSHLSFANYLNPQQTPMVVYALSSGTKTKNAFSTKYSSQLKQEAEWGADFLLKMLDKEGYFYISVFDGFGWNLKPDKSLNRELCSWAGKKCKKTTAYKAGMREGAGMSIAALANCYNNNITGDSKKQRYLDAAIRAYKHLIKHNHSYLNNHQENIIDNYCGLMASIELFKATSDSLYLTHSTKYANYIIDCQSEKGHFYSTPEHKRPFYHAAEEGLPLYALTSFYELTNNDKTLYTIQKNIDWYLSITQATENPFSYIKSIARPYENEELGAERLDFFIPQKNESTYWWQGENARIASLATAFKAAQKIITLDKTKSKKLNGIITDQTDWILGKNPFGVCMMDGVGKKGYPRYIAKAGYTVPNNIPGGICNGITADSSDTGILFVRFGQEENTQWENWRWNEQWITHNAWYLMAINQQN